MTDHNYPPNYKKNDKLQKYIEKALDEILNIQMAAVRDLDAECFREFDKQIKEYINQ